MALFASYCVSAHFLFHVHVIDGAIIVHSHIHPGSHHDTDSGGHSQKGVILLATITSVKYVDFTGDYVPEPSQSDLYQYKFVETASWVRSIYFQNLSLRAPPVV